METWVDKRFKWNSDTFMDQILNAVEDTFSDALKVAIPDIKDNQSAERDLSTLLNTTVADFFTTPV